MRTRFRFTAARWVCHWASGLAAIGGLFAVPAVAATVLPPPSTLVQCAVNSSFLDDPTSCALGNFDTSSASLTLSPFVSLSAQAASPAAPGVHGASAIARATYSFQVIGGSPGDVVPILIATTLTTTSTEPTTLALGFAALTVHTTVVGTTTLAAVCTDGSCGTSASSFSGTLMTRARSGDLGDLLELQAQASVVGIPQHSQFASASADPFIFIDPGFPNASLYSIIVSPGVGNAPQSVPEPFSVEFTTFGLVVCAAACRRKLRGR